MAVACAAPGKPAEEVNLEQTVQTDSATVEEGEADEPRDESEKAQIFSDKLDKKIPVIFSHDGAPDDVATLVYISGHPMIELIGVIQSYGEQHPGKTLKAWQKFLYEVIEYDQIPFGVGNEESVDPARNEFPAGWRTYVDGFFGLDLPASSETYPSSEGADLIIELVKGSPEKVTVLVTGAQTDMALAIQKDPSIIDNISQIVIMGGAFDVGGNLYESSGFEGNEVAEWNIYADPLAAKIVFNSGAPISIVSLDGSDDFNISQTDYTKIKDNANPTLKLLASLWQQQFEVWNGDFKIWDIVAATAMTNPEFFGWTYDGVDVIAEPGSTHGQTITLGNGSEITRYTSSTNYDQVRAAIFEVYEKYQ